MAGISFIIHKGAKIAYQDWSYCKPDEILDLIERAKTMVVHQPKNSALVLINVKGAGFNIWRGRPAGSHLQGHYNFHRQEKHCPG
jgi:hypothetical protein